MPVGAALCYWHNNVVHLGSDGLEKGGCGMKTSERVAGLAGAAALVCVLVLAIGWAAPAAAPGKIDMKALIHETQKMTTDGGVMTLVWWMPEDFWRASALQAPGASDAQAEEFAKVVRPYTLLMVMDGTMGPLAGMTYRPEAEIRASIRIVDSDGTAIPPLPDEQIAPDIRNLMAIMRPMLGNMIGPMGQNTHFYIFPANNAKGAAICDARKEGSFAVRLGEREFKWRLPLGAVLPPKICPKCGDKCSGAWKFCPYDGTALPK
jgi:hypothetical protein